MQIKVGDLVRITKIATNDNKHLGKIGVLLILKGVDDCGYPLDKILVDGDKICVYPDGYEAIND